MHRFEIVASLAVASMVAQAACGGDEPTGATGTGGAAGGGGSTSSGGGGQGGADCAQEICDGLDNDCDGTVDDGFGSETCGIGACETTVSVCQDGQPVTCVPLAPAPLEACDGVDDDDCDGSVDEGCLCVDGQTQSCYTGPAGTQGIGECHDGSQTCAGGAWSTCAGDATPSSEACDDMDNDCDGAVDNGDPGGGVACATGLPGVCAPGTTACQGGVVVCAQDTQPSADVCDGLDNDCDVTTADGSADPGVGAACDGPDPGACTDGIQQCSGGMIVCNDPSDVEQCNALDDDCNGIVNDGIPSCGTCGSPHPVPAGGITGTYQMSGSTTTSGSCGGGGVDRYHLFVPSSSGTASISLVTDYWPSVVYVRQNSCGGSQVVCDYEPGTWPTNVLSFAVTAGTPYYIIVDHGSYNGPITLTYTMTLTAP